ncbi:hypothetical protein NDU88_001777 [Pleurodeles waltl]|uniref:Uncharacterized protein n=1 Tax=Pleurodeles waltl TaxID=8319 RepID=A0AAV7NBQ3_PLEWA|nr:hypothetical protein NDU88_001777 [Pleurodeles waltl]
MSSRYRLLCHREAELLSSPLRQDQSRLPRHTCRPACDRTSLRERPLELWQKLQVGACISGFVLHAGSLSPASLAGLAIDVALSSHLLEIPCIATWFRDTVLRLAQEKTPLQFQGSTLAIYLDFTQAVQEVRKKYANVK